MTTRFERAIVVGASSGIGAALAKQLAAAGCHVALLARREPELATLALEINAQQQGRAMTYPHDVRDYAAVPSLFQTVCRDLGGLDLLIYSSGVLCRLHENEYDFEKDKQTIEVNVLGAMAWINEAAERFTATRNGTIVGIGSVAGDRGRRGMPAYAASKAALDTYLEAIRNRVGRYGVGVVTIKPGPIDTAMTAGQPAPLRISAPEAARLILNAAERRTRLAYVPGQWRYIMAVLRAIPSPLFQKLNI